MSDYINKFIKPKPLWSQVKEIEESYCPGDSERLREIKATLLVNFGPNQSRNPKVIKSETTFGMLMDVLGHQDSRLRTLEKENEQLKESLRQSNIKAMETDLKRRKENEAEKRGMLKAVEMIEGDCKADRDLLEMSGIRLEDYFAWKSAQKIRKAAEEVGNE